MYHQLIGISLAKLQSIYSIFILVIFMLKLLISQILFFMQTQFSLTSSAPVLLLIYGIYFKNTKTTGKSTS